MRSRFVLGVFIAIASLLPAQEEVADAPKMTPKEEVMEQLLSERESAEALDKAIQSARNLGIPEQAILESKFLFHVDRSEDAEIAKMLPQLVKQSEHFKLSDSAIFGSEDDWLAIVEYARAIDALQKGEKQSFKKHITEAFWLSPRQGTAFAPHIERIRLMDAMKEVKLDKERKYLNTLNAEKTSLGELMAEKKGVMLHFWSPLSPECEGTLADFFITADHLTKNGISVASVLPETSDKVIAAAKAMLLATGKDIPGHWIVDVKESPLSAQLKVESVPAVVLIDAAGEIIYNGHPSKEEFWDLLEKLNPEIKRPDMREE
ncbi:MAG: redoxin domain-containing protein [Verrucomicrobiota bacterium]